MADETRSMKKCFLIGPIGRKGEEENYHADLLLNYIIKNVLEADPFKYQVIRADQADDPGMVLTRIVNDIFDSDLIVADLSFRNANVFWELGIAHTISKPVICFKRPNDAVPFDLDQHRVISVDLADWHSHEAARKLLASYAEKISETDFRPSNPVTQARDHYELQSSGDPKERIIAKLEERIDILEAEQRKQRNFQQTEWLRLGEAFDAESRLMAQTFYRNKLAHLRPSFAVPPEAGGTGQNVSENALAEVFRTRLQKEWSKAEAHSDKKTDADDNEK